MLRITREYTCDVLVLGAGAAGLTAAVRAAQAGRKVIVLEKTPFIGGSMGYANFTRIFDSAWQARRGLKSTTGDYLRDVQDKAGWQFLPELAAKAVRATGECFDWLLKLAPELEERFTVGRYIFPTEYDPEGPMIPFGDGLSFGEVMCGVLKNACETYEVSVMTESSAVDTETAGGRVTAVIAQDENGYFRVNCKACVLSSGSWSANDAAVSEICPDFDRRTQEITPHVDPVHSGDGLALAQSAGAEIDKAGMCMHLIRTTGVNRDPVLRMLMRSPAQICVNVNGERFCCEPISRLGRSVGGFIQMAQPYGISWCVFDTDCLQAACKIPPAEPDNLERTYEACELPAGTEELSRMLDKECRIMPDKVIRAGSPEELADRLGVDKPVFLRTLREYNESCALGRDEIFVKPANTLIPLKTAPYYAIRVTADLLGATGGVKTDKDLRVLNADDEPIENFFAAGDVASGGSLRNGSAEVHLLNELSWALAGGYMAGGAAAKLEFDV